MFIMNLFSDQALNTLRLVSYEDLALDTRDTQSLCGAFIDESICEGFDFFFFWLSWKCETHLAITWLSNTSRMKYFQDVKSLR